MMEKTTVKVFIGSSAEVEEERKNFTHYLSSVNESFSHLHLKAVKWESSIVPGNFAGYENIQKAIDPALEESKLCVFVFDTKIGENTLKEFKLARELKKKLFVFFKSGFSPKTKGEISKWSELIAFKEGMNDTILYKDYHTITEFELLLTQNLNLYLSQEFSLQSSHESEEIKKLKAELYDKQKEIAEFKDSSLGIGNAETKKQLELLEQEKNALITQLSESKEIQQQQAKEKQELETRLAPQIKKDNLKQQALAAIQENNYDEAETLLKESAKDSISETASTFYELGKLKKIQLLYKDALYYFELAVSIKPDDFEMNMDVGSILRNVGYNDKSNYTF